MSLPLHDKLDWSEVERVLLVRLRSIGDTVLMTPCLEALQHCRPGIKIAVVSEPLAAPLLKNHPLVDELFIAEANTTSRARLLLQLRRRHFDVAFNLHGGTTATLITRFSGACWTVGYEDYRGSGMLRLRAPSPDLVLGKTEIHSVEQQLALLYFARVPKLKSPRLQLTVSDAAIQRVRERLSAADMNAEKGFALISPAAAFVSKQWAESRFAEIVDHIAERYHLPSVIIAGRGEEQIAVRIASLAQHSSLVMTGLSLKELAALISLSSLFAGNDSGPMHVAAAFARPMVAIFGSSNPTVWKPWTTAPHRVVHAPETVSPESRIAEIPVAKVAAAIEAVMKEAESKRVSIP